MMTLSILELEGDPGELMARMEEHVVPVASRLASEMGGLSTTAVRTDTGIMIVNVWADEHGRHKLADHPEMWEALQKAGMPEPHARAYDVLSHQAREAAPA